MKEEAEDMKRKILCVLMVLSLITVSLAGCKSDNPGKTQEPGQGTVTAPDASGQTQQTEPEKPQNDGQGTVTPGQQEETPTAEPTPTPTPEPTAVPEPEGRTYDDGFRSPVAGGKDNFDEQKLTSAGYTVVSSSGEFIEAIGPGARIVLKPGEYNLSEYIEKIWIEKGEEWNSQHQYVRLESVFDGVQLVIMNTDDLMISGGSEERADTLLVVESRYAAVLTFEKCRNIGISNLTAGHTESGDCSGNVIDLMGAKKVGMYNLDLYGCGVYGIGAARGWEDVSVYDSTVRDCASGPFQISEGLGTFSFYDCDIHDSGWCEYTDTVDSSLYFESCRFGEYESNSLQYVSDVTTKDCEFAEIIDWYADVDPEYEEYYELDDPEFDPSDFDFDSMEAAMGRDYAVMSPGWTAYMIVDPSNGDTTYIPHYDEASEKLMYYSCGFYLSDDQPYGYMIDSDEYTEFKWYYSSLSSIVIEMPDGTNYYGDLYRDMDAERAHTWLMLQMGKYIVWFY